METPPVSRRNLKDVAFALNRSTLGTSSDFPQLTYGIWGKPGVSTFGFRSASATSLFIAEAVIEITTLREIDMLPNRIVLPMMAIFSILTSFCCVNADDETSELHHSLKVIADRHKNFLVRGTTTRERFLPADAESHLRKPIEFRRLGNDMRLVSQTNSGGDRIVVSTESLSFDVEKQSDGKEVVKYLSPRRGLGFDDLRQTMLFEAGVYAAYWSFHFDSYADMLHEGRLELVATDRSSDARLVYDIVRMVPRKEVLHPDSTLLHYEGELVVENSDPLRIGSIKLKTIYPEGETLPPAWLSGRFEYREIPDREVSPVLATAVWEMRTGPDEPVEVRWTFEVEDIEFGIVHPDDFTLAGCGIKTVNTSGAYSNIPLLAWYGGMVFVLCVVGIWLIRRRQRSTA